jgi:hypothetical protein
VAALTATTALAGCGGSSTPTTSPVATQAVRGASDIQLLGALTLTKDTLAGAFPGQAWRPWSANDADQATIGIKALRNCGADVDTAKTTQVSENFFQSAMPSVTGPASPTSSSTKHPTSTPTTTTSAPSTSTTDWVGSLAAIYKTSADAQAALGNFSSLSSPSAACGSADKFAGKQDIRGPGHTGETWYGNISMALVYDTVSKQTVSAVAQVRGRFVIVVYARGSAELSNGYYTLNGTDDTTAAANAATTLLGQLTDAVVNGG